MSERLEEELMEDLSYEEAEGAAELYEEEEGFEEYDAFDEAELGEEEFEGMEEGYFEEEFEGEGYEGFEEFGGDYADEDAEDAFEDAMAYALGAEDMDEFLGKLWGGIKKAAKKVGGAVGRVARVAAPIARLIPHPYAQIAAKGLGLLSKLRAEGASEEEAMEAFAELAAYDEAALPLVAGLAARSIVKRKGARLPFAVRKKLVKDMSKAAKTLVRRRGLKAIRALPKIVKSVKRTAVAKRTPLRVVPKIVRRTTVNVTKSPKLVRKLSRPSPLAIRRVRTFGARVGGYTVPGPTSYTVPGPVRITITGAA